MRQPLLSYCITKTTPKRCRFVMATEKGPECLCIPTCSSTQMLCISVPSSHQKAKKYATGIFFLTLFALTGFEPLLSYCITKTTPKRCRFVMATERGLDPSTSSVTGWHSNQLNYSAKYLVLSKYFVIISLSFAFVNVFFNVN